MKNRLLSSQEKLAPALVFIFIGVAFCYGLLETWLERKEAVAAAESFLNEAADHHARMVEEWVMARVSAARLIAHEPDQWTDRARTTADLFRHRSFNNHSAVCVYGSADHALACSPSYRNGTVLRGTAMVGAVPGAAVFLDGSGPAECLIGFQVHLPKTPRTPFGSAVTRGVVWEDPSEALFPFLSRIPSPLGEAEVLLALKKQDGSALYLNPLPLQESAGFLRVPLASPRLAARAALEGRPGFGRFTDYAGTEVFAAVRPVPGVGWGLVAMLPVSSVFSASQDHLVINWLLVASLVILGILAHAYWQQNIQRLRQEKEATRASLDRSQETLAIMARDAITTLAPPICRFTGCNQSTVRLFRTGSKEKFTSLGPWELSPETQPDGESSASKAKRMIKNAMRDGSAFFEWTHRSLDGRDFPATVLLSRITILGKTLLQATVRDIAAAKKTSSG